jgi:hypothetical protein
MLSAMLGTQLGFAQQGAEASQQNNIQKHVLSDDVINDSAKFVKPSLSK